MNPWTIVIAVLLWLASLAGVGWWQRTDGATIERDTWQKRENTELRTANAKIKELEAKAKSDTSAHAQALAEASTAFERKLKDANAQRAKDRAAVLAGTLRLRDNGATGLRACGSGISPPAAGASVGDGRTPGELSAAATGFLLDLASDADDIAHQLAQAQAVIREDRRLCGRPAR
ncbi:MAG: bacteriophage lysis protein [Proteobacteria bacterium]|nr:bacteriophage lysis protein [Pseudomonadota bacterium]